MSDPDDDFSEQIDAAERRGIGRGTILGLGLAVLIVLVAAIGLVFWNPFADEAPPIEETSPPATQIEPTTAPTGDFPIATATVVTPNPDETTTTAPTAGNTLALTRWNWFADQNTFSVAGFIDGAEQGGTCTLTAASGGVTLVATQPAATEVTTTTCIVNLQSADVIPGDWQLTMTYDGPSGQATSETVTLTVPE